MKTIGVIQTGYHEKFGIPRQSGLVQEARGVISFAPEFRNPQAVRGLEQFSHIWVLWKFSASQKEHWSATVKPPRLGGKTRVGVFATRSPYRPNDIGLSCVRLERIELDSADGPLLHVAGVDMLDGTPIYDIKPYIPYADCHPEATEGYTKETKAHRLQVVFPKELLARYPVAEQQAVCELLALDPRQTYFQDPERVYGMAYGAYNVRFRVQGEQLTVVGVEPL